ncbi:hypothetical protein CYLTODRAFT_492472 [Cylindrobasidium torrendii FP15055 ss-10]|uniref:Zinc finger GRF-type domain-containing protein n=1 Tax=Cylindrobasidium torrendii FP15055 ss-10 TaxID=1314674 RepID=A0A0D7B3U6_9AGAR|nr:hypothetical protein CYLTODRAFT_492472 [Cylindrobasidium torrendii FP15055 ss-10]
MSLPYKYENGRFRCTHGEAQLYLSGSRQNFGREYYRCPEQGYRCTFLWADSLRRDHPAYRPQPGSNNDSSILPQKRAGEGTPGPLKRMKVGATDASPANASSSPPKTPLVSGELLQDRLDSFSLPNSDGIGGGGGSRNPTPNPLRAPKEPQRTLEESSPSKASSSSVGFGIPPSSLNDAAPQLPKHYVSESSERALAQADALVRMRIYELEKNIFTLRGQETEKENEIARLEESNRELKERRQEQQSEIAQLEASIRELEEKRKDQDARYKELGESMDRLFERSEELREENGKLADENERLKAYVEFVDEDSCVG